MSGLFLRGATLLPGGDDWSPRPGLDLHLEAGRVAALGAGLPVPPGAHVLEATHLLLLPAFRNAHTHSPEALVRGRAPLARLEHWLGAAYGDGADAMDLPTLRRAVIASAVDTVRGGAAEVTDHLRQIPQRPEAVAAASRAWAGTGLSARIAVMLRDRAMPHGLEAPSLHALLDLAAACLAGAQERVAVGLGPSAPQRCSDALLTGLHRLAREAGSFLHLHLCETAEDAAACRALYGRSAVSHLHALGLLGPGTELAHCVHVEEEDLAILAGTGAVMIHNPLANLRLGSGIAPVARALAKGVRVRLGSDGAASNDSQSMLEAAKMALLLPRAARPQSEWPRPEKVLAMATAGAMLAPGEAADLLAFDLRAPAFAGARPEELAPRLLLAAREADIVHLIAAGRFLIEDRRLTGFDASAEGVAG